MTQVRLLVAAETEAARVDALEAALSRSGIEVTDNAAAEVLALPSGEATLPGNLTEGFIPVVLGATASTVLPALSQLIVPPGDESRAAERIKLLAQLPPDLLIRINTLVAAAARWRTTAAPALLLRADDLVAAGPPVSLAHQVNHPEAPLLSEFLRASRERNRRQRRRRWTISGAAAALLLVFGVVAGVQAYSSTRAGQRSLLEARIADSTRLARNADAILNDQAPDPDLPAALISEALALHPTPEALHVARRVAYAIPAHTSFLLPKELVYLSAGGDRLALGYADGSVEIRDVAGAILETHSTGRPGDAYPVLSEDGSRLAIVDSEGRVALSAGSEPPAKGQTPGLDLMAVAWRGAEFLGVSAEGELLSFGADGTASPVPLSEPLKGVSRVAFSGDGLRAVTTTPRGVALIETRTGAVRFLPTPPVAGTGSAKLSADGGYVLLTTREGSAAMDLSAAEPAWKSGPGAFTAYPLPGGLVLRAQDGSGDICPATLPSLVASRCITAHRGRIRAAVRVGDAVVTAGADNHLRVWPDLREPAYPRPNANAAGGFDLRRSYGQRGAGTRSRVEFDPTTGRVVTLTHAHGLMTLSFRDGRQPASELFLGLPIGNAYALAPGGGSFAFANDRRVAVYPTREQTTPLWTSDETVPAVDLHLELSADGHSLVGATPSNAYAWRDGVRVRLGGTGNAQPVGIDPVSTSVWLADGSTVASLAAGADPTLPPILAAAALPSGRAVWITADGAIQEELAEGPPRTIAQLNPDPSSYALKSSADGHLLAVIRDDEAVVLRMSDGTVLFRSATRTIDSAIDDVAFLDERTFLTVEHSGGLRTEQLSTDADIQEQFRTPPRALTAEERADHALTER